MITNDEYNICRTQGEIFQLAACQGYDMEMFSQKYLSSDFCGRQFDCRYSRYQYADAEESWDIFWPELADIVPQYNNGLCFSPDIAEWIGFTYRQLWYETYIPSRALVSVIPFNDMRRLYYGYHTLDEDMAADDLMRVYHLDRRKKMELER